jgi:hypothetical protein
VNELAVPDDELMLYVSPELMRLSVCCGLLLEHPTLETASSSLHSHGVISSFRSRLRSLCRRIRLRIVPASLLEAEDEYLGEATPRLARSEPRRDARPTDKPEPSFPKQRAVVDEPSAPVRRTVAWSCGRCSRPNKDSFRDTERCKLRRSSDD